METIKRIPDIVLIVSHSHTSAMPLRRRLVDMGYQNFREAESAAAALQSTQPSPDLIIFDSNIRDMSGIEFVQNLRRGLYMVKTRVILICKGPDDAERMTQALVDFDAVLCTTRAIHEKMFERL